MNVQEISARLVSRRPSLWGRAIFVLLPLLLTACHNVSTSDNGTETPPTPRRTEIRVAAAADLTDAFTEIGIAFEKETGTKVSLTFGATGQLTTQIENGAPFDVFAAADNSYVTRLEKGGKTVSGTSQVYAIGTLALWTKKSTKDAGKVADLSVWAKTAPLRVAIANPEVAPYGRAAKEALHNAGVLAQIEPKLAYAENVRQARQYAQTGNVDAALLPISLTKGLPGSALPIPENLYTPLQQMIVLLKPAVHSSEAYTFENYVMGKGKVVLARHGFALPKNALR